MPFVFFLKIAQNTVLFFDKTSCPIKIAKTLALTVCSTSAPRGYKKRSFKNAAIRR